MNFSASLLSASIILAATSPTFAQVDVMANFYGNTLIAKGGLADSQTVYTRDHRFVMTVPSFGLEFKGAWAVKDGQVCRVFETTPPGVTNPLCTPAQPHAVGETWTSMINGKPVSVTLAKGLQ